MQTLLRACTTWRYARAGELAQSIGVCIGMGNSHHVFARQRWYGLTAMFEPGYCVKWHVTASLLEDCWPADLL
jgi:hypothetical protein